jgi:hypothetical protein
MKTFKTAALIPAFIGLAGALLSTVAMAGPGQGWDVFHSGQGERIPASSQNVSASNTKSAGKGWDVMRTGAGEPIPVSGQSVDISNSRSAGKGWDVMRTGAGEPIPAAGLSDGA